MSTGLIRRPSQPRTPGRRARVRDRRLAGGLLGAAVCIAAAAPIAVYLWVALHRIGYPYELDWMEGGSVELAARVAAGKSLYVAPSLAFVGWTYPPLYYWVTGALGSLTAVGFPVLRLVSFAASLGTMVGLAAVVIRETRNRTAGLVAAGSFAATFVVSGAWFDIGRVDSLFLALTLAAVAWGRWARGVSGGIVLGALTFLAFFTKQTGLLALAPVLAYATIARPRTGIAALVTTATLVLGSTLLLDLATGGWYRYYVIAELAGQPWARHPLSGFWLDDLLAHEWPLVLLIVAGALVSARRARPVRFQSAAVYYAFAAAGLIGTAWVSRLHTGGYLNVLMPAYAAIALLSGLTYGHLWERPLLTRWALAAPVIVALALLAYPIAPQIPTGADRAAGAALIARLRQLPGPVLVFRHPWYATIAGKGSFAQEEGLGDVLRSGATRGERSLRSTLRDALNGDHIQAVVLDGTFDEHFFATELARDFRRLPQPITAQRLYPLTDVRTSPTLLYLRVRPG